MLEVLSKALPPLASAGIDCGPIVTEFRLTGNVKPPPMTVAPLPAPPQEAA
jgi:hypothetical protein